MTFLAWDHYEWRGPSRQRAVELFAQQIAYAELEKQETITLPPHAANVIYACAKAGARKGRGRGNAMTTRRHAVETLRQQIVNEEITLPLHTARVLRACARDGQHKGRGRGRPPDSELNRIAKKSVSQWTREREDELVAHGHKSSRAKEQAAEEAQAQFYSCTGRSAGYIKRKAHSKS